MQFIDWVGIIVPLAVVFLVGLYTQRYMRSVRDFVSGGRIAGPYLLAVARGEMFAGAATFVALFELIGNSGFTFAWWDRITFPVMLLVSISGFVVYRFRETRAMTLAQFFEQRYSRPFRLFTGILGFVAGLANFGIIPIIGARVMVFMFDLPQTFSVVGFTIPTAVALMGLLMTISVTISLSGGLITVMVTDCLGGLMSELFYLVIIAALLCMFSWGQISTVLLDRPPGHSLVNPFDSMGLKDFNVFYILMMLYINVYGTMAWQNSGGYNAAAVSPHASVMASILGRWRESGKMALITLLTVCAITFLKHPDFAQAASGAHAQIDSISDPQLRQQMSIPIAAVSLLPVGVKGLFCVILLLGIFGVDSTQLHSWGSILVQDIVIPLRKKPLSATQHIRALRLSVLGVATFAFLFGCWFKQTQYIIMWWQITSAIYLGGAGACIIGGLYWKKGTTAGAWSALLTGSGLAVSGIFAQQRWGASFPLNGIEVAFTAAVSAMCVYVIVSLLTHREDHDMDRLLHRNRYSDQPAPASSSLTVSAVGPAKTSFWAKLLRIDGNFTRSERIIAIVFFSWSLLWLGVFLVGTIWNLIAPWSVPAWLAYCRIAGIGIPVVYVSVTAVWFAWGGLRDIRSLFARLRELKVNNADNGSVPSSPATRRRE